MKNSLWISAAFALGAVASPIFDKRVLVTDIEVTVVTITVTETPGAATQVPTAVPASTTAPAAGIANLQNNIPLPSISTSTTSIVVEASSTSSPSPVVVSSPPATTAAPVVVTTAAPVATTSSTPAAAPSGYQGLILDSHNIHRSNHSAPALTWNQTLAESALALANTCDYHHDT